MPCKRLRTISKFNLDRSVWPYSLTFRVEIEVVVSGLRIIILTFNFNNQLIW